MKFLGEKVSCKQFLFLCLYYGFFRSLPMSRFPLVGGLCKAARVFCCRRIFARCGKDVNIERNAFFWAGTRIRLGDRSGLGVNCNIPSDTVIGDNVMMGPNCFILNRNHNFDRVDLPIIEQGYGEAKQTVIGSDVWIGRDVTFTPGRTVGDGTVIGAGTLLCKDFPAYSIVGGNPARLIRSRK